MPCPLLLHGLVYVLNSLVHCLVAVLFWQEPNPRGSSLPIFPAPALRADWHHCKLTSTNLKGALALPAIPLTLFPSGPHGSHCLTAAILANTLHPPQTCSLLPSLSLSTDEPASYFIQKNRSYEVGRLPFIHHTEACNLCTYSSFSSDTEGDLCFLLDKPVLPSMFWILSLLAFLEPHKYQLCHFSLYVQHLFLN